MRYLVGRSMIFLMLVVTGSWSLAGDSEEAFWRAAKTGDVAVVQQQLDEGRARARDLDRAPPPLVEQRALAHLLGLAERRIDRRRAADGDGGRVHGLAKEDSGRERDPPRFALRRSRTVRSAARTPRRAWRGQRRAEVRPGWCRPSSVPGHHGGPRVRAALAPAGFLPHRVVRALGHARRETRRPGPEHVRRCDGRRRRSGAAR